MRRGWDWYWTLSGGRQALAFLLLLALGSALSFLATSTAMLWWPTVAQEGGSLSGSSASSAPQRTESTYISKPPPKDMDLRITRARWVGQRVVVEGGWSGDVSSVYCDLFEGDETEARVTDWWERGVPAKMSWSERTFTQEFVEAKGREIEDPVDPKKRYWVLCSGNFTGGWGMQPSAAVKGTPPG
jgi:hypothetical protein